MSAVDVRSPARHFDLGDRLVWRLPNRIDVLPKEQVPHRRVADHDHLVNGRRIDGNSSIAWVRYRPRAPQELSGMDRVVLDARHHVRAPEPLWILERRVGDLVARLEVEQAHDHGRRAEIHGDARGSAPPIARPRRHQSECDRRPGDGRVKPPAGRHGIGAERVPLDAHLSAAHGVTSHGTAPARSAAWHDRRNGAFRCRSAASAATATRSLGDFDDALLALAVLRQDVGTRTPRRSAQSKSVAPGGASMVRR
jgi:hypothetical protein